MRSLKDKMYNYEVNPPSESWELITTALDNGKTNDLSSSKKRGRLFYYSFGVAAAIAVFIFSLIFWNNNNDKKANGISSNGGKDARITVPETSTANNKNNSESGKY